MSPEFEDHVSLFPIGGIFSLVIFPTDIVIVHINLVIDAMVIF